MVECINCGIKCSGVRCRKCHNKTKGNFIFGKWQFDTQKNLDINIKFLLKESPRNIEFENQFFKELINTYHKGVNYEKLKVTKFKILDYSNQIGKWKYARDRFRGNFLVTGYFEPVGEWYGVTVYPHKKSNVRQKLIEGLRQKWAEKAEIRKAEQLCENCNIIPYPQLHHDNISFAEIAEECMKLFTKKELEIGIGNNWWKYECECDELPDDHPAVLEMFKLHENVTYKWLCYNCHKKVHKKKKKEKHGTELFGGIKK